MKFDFDSLTGGPQIYDDNASRASGRSENAFTRR